MTVHIDVLTPMPEGWEMCQTCNLIMKQAHLPQENPSDCYPKEWQEEFQKTSNMIITLAKRFGASVKITIYDPRSLQGLIKALRFGINRYPAYIIAKKYKYIGWDIDRVHEIITLAGGIPLQAPNNE